MKKDLPENIVEDVAMAVVLAVKHLKLKAGRFMW